jgi:hypothetical protein
MSDIIEVIKDVTTVTIASDGPQGPTGPTGATGATGPAGPTGSSGVISVVAPITNTGTSTAAIIGINAGVANGVATLDSGGKVPQSQIPAVAITNTFVVASQAAMLALTAEEGDVAVRTDQNKTYILTATPASTLANWQELLTPTDTVTSVDGRIGTVTLTDKYAQLATANTFTGGVQQITTANANTIGLIVNRSTSQTANLVELRDESAVNSGGISSGFSFYTIGRISVGFNSAQGGYKALVAGNTATTDIVLGVRGIASQSADLQQWQNSGGTVLAKVTSSGSGQFGTIGGVNGVLQNLTGFQASTNITTRVNLTVTAIASQTANLQEWQNSAGTVLSYISSSGEAVLPTLGVGGSSFGISYVRFSSAAGATGAVTMALRAIASQGGNLFQAQLSDGTVRTRIDAFGTFILGTATANYGAWLNIQPALAADRGIVVRAQTSQTANLQEWQDSSGTVLSSIDSSGRLFVNTTTNNFSSIQAVAYASGSHAITVRGFSSGTTAAARMIAGAAGQVSLIVTGAPSHTADLQQLVSGGGTILTAFTNNGTINFVTGNTSATATAGAVTLPALAVGFITMQVAGTTVKVPYYAN